MTTTPDLLNRLRSEWRHAGASLPARRAAQHFAERHRELELDFVDDLVDVVRLCESRGPRKVLERARIVQALLEDARDPLIHRALLQTLLPGIVSVCRQLRFGAGIVDEPGETLAVATALCAELLYDWAGQSRPYAAPDVLSALRGRLRRHLLKEKEERRILASDANNVAHAAQGSSTTLQTRLEAMRGTPHERLARLTYARVFEGVSLKELAAADRSAPQSLQHELQCFARRHLI
ncbi:MAG: hypothetical protein B7X07_04360 [Actinobacteria bacterium 21-64-8]|nr:MAG: hypothetical protein B7X07_04360 [Actinobacteria bacterium 21-64-8]